MPPYIGEEPIVPKNAIVASELCCYTMPDMSETKEELSPKEERQKKAALVRKAVMISVLVFFFGIGFFVLIVMGIVKLASKTPGA